MTTLSAHDLAFGWSRRRVGAVAEFTLAAGEAVALLGPNGGGKTTLLKTLIGLIPAQSGDILLDGRPLADVPVRERARRIGYVPQAHVPTFDFSVRDLVLMGRTAQQGLFARPSAADRTICDSMLERLGIGALADRPATMISGGERQLALIARALAQDPALVVLDEPTASLDFGNQGKVMRRISDLTRSGLGVLFTTHDPNQALHYADRIVMLADGGIRASGPPSVVLTPTELAALYKAPVEMVEGRDGRRAFLPG